MIPEHGQSEDCISLVKTTCRECGAAVVLTGLMAYESFGPHDLCNQHYAEWCRANLNRRTQ